MAQDSVTQQTAAADRMRRMRARRKSGPSQPLLFERADWKLFLDPQSLPQKAGCEPHQIGRVVLKELVDNALDAGAGAVTLTGNACRCVIADGGPGIDPAQLPKLFAVNRPLLSSKLKRLPTRGMLGNGLRVVMGAVAALNGAINVTTRGQRYRLDIDRFAGTTRMEPMTAAPDVQGLRVELHFPQPLFDSGEFNFARMAIQLAGSGYSHAGASLPGWYSPTALCDLLAAAPQEVPPSEVISDVFGITAAVTKPSERWAAAFINQAPRHPDPRIGEIGSDAIDGEYSARTGTVEINGAQIPYCVEAWVSAEMAGKDDNTRIALHPLLNRSPTLALLYGHADSTGLRLQGCGIDVKVNGPKRADYRIFLSLITPYLRLTGDGKAPFLGDFQAAIATVLKDAATQAYRSLVRPAASISVADAAALVMCAAYLKASDNGTLPAKARQIMYAARGRILELTGLKTFSDTYFTQRLLPDYLQDNPRETAPWDVVYDARGNLTEPHTGRRVPLGTVPVREYLGQRLNAAWSPRLVDDSLYPTIGPRHRYGNVLFVEKEGFDELFEAVRLAERYDLAIMSTKGMSVVAARALIDRLAETVEHVFVLHDFDVSGFSILGTLGTDSRRYTFAHDLSGIVVDLGLRLADVEVMGLESEIVEVRHRDARRETLERHGATEHEIEFLAPWHSSQDCRRVELNAMTSRQLVDFVEEALAAHGVAKVIPDAQVLLHHARQRLENKLTGELIATHAEAITQRAAAMELPPDLGARVAALLEAEPALSWDQAVAKLVG